jgi:phosphopantothenoylcysteine decarboxylase/phosphopantothenate--cysteine ligase
LKRTPDILASIAKRKGRRVVIGFCLETRDLLKRAMEKLIRKRLNGIVANFYGRGRIPFGKRRIEVSLIDADGKVRRIANRSKAQVSKTLLGWMESLAA